jgi:hypothetical protein
VPRPVVFAAGKCSEILLGLIGRGSPLSVYRLRSALASRTFESRQAYEALGWKPRVGVREGIRRVLNGDRAEPATPALGEATPSRAVPAGRSE